MVEKMKTEVQTIKLRIAEPKNIDEMVRKKAKIKENIDILDEIIADGAISNANLRLASGK